MHPTSEQMQAARLANLEAALAAFLRCALEQGYDGFTASVERDPDSGLAIDLTFTVDGVPHGGQSL